LKAEKLAKEEEERIKAEAIKARQLVINIQKADRIVEYRVKQVVEDKLKQNEKGIELKLLAVAKK